MLANIPKQYMTSCEKYYDQRNYIVYQQALFLVLLNQKYDLILKQSSKHSTVTTQLVRIVSIGNKEHKINVTNFIEKRCKEKMEKDKRNGLGDKTTYRRYSANKIIETHHLLIDLLREFGLYFDSIFSSGKNNSSKMETILNMYDGNGTVVNKEHITILGNSISNYFNERVVVGTECTFKVNDPFLQSFLN